MFEPFLVRAPQLLPSRVPRAAVSGARKLTTYTYVSGELPTIRQALARAAEGKPKGCSGTLESGLVLSWGDESGLFVAGAVYLKEAFGSKCSGIHFLAELKWDNGVLTAVDDQNGSVYFL